MKRARRTKAAKVLRSLSWRRASRRKPPLSQAKNAPQRSPDGPVGGLREAVEPSHFGPVPAPRVLGDAGLDAPAAQEERRTSLRAEPSGRSPDVVSAVGAHLSPPRPGFAPRLPERQLAPAAP